MQADTAARELGVRRCLDRIREADSSIHAWVQVSPEQPTGAGKLDGIPFAVKDVIETDGLATEYGSPIYKGRFGDVDAAIVRDLRQRGGIVLGKTQCSGFAWRTPSPTRNPRNLDHTPGGSSSGSAAAVAADMVPFALGTQTRGSVLRPASYCGVTGFKPTYGWMSVDGVLPLAPSQDTLGLFTHSASDMLVLWDATGRDVGADETLALAVPEPLQDVEPEMSAAFAATIAVLRRAGVTIFAVPLGDMLDRLSEANDLIVHYEAARIHESRYRQYGSRLDDIATLVRKGLQISTKGYEGALRYVDECKHLMIEVRRRAPVIILPAAPGPAPKGLTSTGDARMNAAWTALGDPAISIPMPVGDRLPLGLQLTAAPGHDARVLRTAARLEKILAFHGQ